MKATLIQKLDWLPTIITWLVVISILIITRDIRFALGYSMGVLMCVGLESVFDELVHKPQPPQPNRHTDQE